MAMKVPEHEIHLGGGESAADRLRHAIDHAAHLLPAQGPITVFIHHNTLHAFEHLTFEEAVKQGADAFGCQPYLSESRYRNELGRGRIRESDLQAVLEKDLRSRAAGTVAGMTTRLELRLALLKYPVWQGKAAELEFAIAETEALRKVRNDVSAASRRMLIAETRRWAMRDFRSSGSTTVPPWVSQLFQQFKPEYFETWTEETWEQFTLASLWKVCQFGTNQSSREPIQAPASRRARDLVLNVVGIDPDLWVNELLVRFCAAFLDQGVSPWPLPNRDEGFFRCFLATYSAPFGPPDAWMSGLLRESRRLRTAEVSAIDCALESLRLLGTPESEWESYLSGTLLSLRGWGGMVREVETRGDRVARPIPAGSLIEFVAVRLLLDRIALSHVARTELEHRGLLSEVPAILAGRVGSARATPGIHRSFTLFQLAQVMGWSSADLARLAEEQWKELVSEIDSFDELERRRVFHLAYERRFRMQALDAFAKHDRIDIAATTRPRFQAITCLDEREESFRRHLEEVAPDAETFGAAGFFNVAMYYRGAADAHFVPLCPIVLTPQHWVEEQPDQGHELAHRQRAQARRALGTAAHGLQSNSRSAVGGAVIAATLGALAAVPLVARVLFPRLVLKAHDYFGRYVRSPKATRLRLERSDAKASSENGGLGYSVQEMATVADRLLRDIGLTRQFARLVFILGHGSDSLNNPHKSAYDCGACGGSPGAPNGRALAQMLNDHRVRALISEKGIIIPDDTWFVGGYHNTCDDSVSLSDIDRVPESHRAELAVVRRDFDATGDRNAHERCRRFMSARLDLQPEGARKHVEARSGDLAQTRPELGHATNAICVAGRRSRTRGLFLDRRAFLASYDPTQDDADGSTLARILGAAVPVCGGINLEYYFSHVDSQGYGCGTKLPHNVTSLLGVMDGAASDLRTGLPWQMVEIHEPVRLLFVVESTPDVLFRVMSRNAVVGGMIRNGWVQMTLLDPDSGAISVFRDGEFIPYLPSPEPMPKAPSSADWYRGWREHLEFAEIG